MSGLSPNRQRIDESALRDTIYPDHQIPKGNYTTSPCPLRQQLSKGGVRLAAYLNELASGCKAEEVASEAACAN
ncbi:MAG: hypothetical protein R3C04_07325 [Hyphomonas sp.]